MITLKNKILIKLIFIISILMIVALNLFGEEKIEFKYYYYTNKLYHSTLKTEIIPSEYVFITTNSTNGIEYSYLYNLKTKEKKLFYVYKSYYYYECYDINGNLTTDWTDKNMQANGFYEITNNRFGETFYTRKLNDSEGEGLTTTIEIYKENGYIQKAYKYSLTQPEIINKKDRGIYLFSSLPNFYHGYDDIVSFLCFQNEYYKNGYFAESDLLNYTNGRGIVHEYDGRKGHYLIYYSYYHIDLQKRWIITSSYDGDSLTNIVYFQLNNKSLIKPTWNEFTNNYLNNVKNYYRGRGIKDIHYSKSNIEHNLKEYNKINDIKYLGFIPIEEFEYYLLAD